jgi:hypothetical protein
LWCPKASVHIHGLPAGAALALNFYGWQAAVRETGGGFWRFWNEETRMKRRLGMENETTCIPHSLR